MIIHDIDSTAGRPACGTPGQRRRPHCGGWTIATVLLALAAATPTWAQGPDCIEYGQFVHWAAGTTLTAAPPAGSTGTTSPTRGDLVLAEHPFAPGHEVAFCYANEFITNNAHLGHLTAVDVTDPLALELATGDDDEIGYLTMAGAPYDIRLDPDFPIRPYLYFCTSDMYFQIVEVGDPDPLDPANLDLTLTVVGSSAEGAGLNATDPVAIDLQVRGAQTLLYVCSSGTPDLNGRLRIFDVTDPGAAVLLSSISLGEGSTRDMVVNGNVAYVTHHYGGLVLDVTNPAAPTSIGSLGMPSGADMELSPDAALLYMTCLINGSESQTWGLSVLDISTPATPVLLAQRGLAHGFEETGNDMVIRGDRLYTNTVDGIIVADISDPAQAHVIARSEANGLGAELGIAVSGDYAFGMGALSGLQAVDISAGISPAPLGNIADATNIVHVLGDILLTGTGHVYDISDPLAPAPLSTIPAHGDAELIDQYAITATTSTLQVWDLSDPASPVLLASAAGGGWNSEMVAFHENGSPLITVLVPGNQGNGYFYSFDPQNPAGFARTGSTQGGRAFDLDEQCGLIAGVVSSNGRIDLWHRSDYHAGIPTNSSLQSVELYGDYLFAGERYTGVRIFDISDPDTPVELPSLQVPDRRGAFNVEAVDGVLYVTQGDGGIWLADISDPANPVPIGDANPSGAAYPPTSTVTRRDVVVAHDVAYWADFSNGIWIMPVQCAVPQEVSRRAIGATAGPGGSISPSGTVVVPHGCGYHLFTLTPDPGFVIADVTVDGVSIGPVAEYAFTDVVTDHTIHATFAMDAVANTLQRFEAAVLTDGVRLAWLWSSPGEIIRTEIERADDANGPWLALPGTIEMLDGELTLTDHSAPPGRTVWYRLSVTTITGSTATFAPVAVHTGGPKVLYMAPVSPNPVVASASIRLSLPVADHVRIAVYDVRGHEVDVLADGPLEAGAHEFTWTGLTPTGRAAAGVYFVQVQSGRHQVTRNLILTR